MYLRKGSVFRNLYEIFLIMNELKKLRKNKQSNPLMTQSVHELQKLHLLNNEYATL